MKNIIRKTQAIVAIFGEEGALLNSLEDLKLKGFNILDVFTPYPIQAIERILPSKKSSIPTISLIFGIVGLACAILMQIYVHENYVLILGNKPVLPMISFVPVTFAITILFAVIGAALSFIIGSNLIPGQKARIYYSGTTNDKFCIIIEIDKNKEIALETLKKHNVEKVIENEYVKQNVALPIPLNLEK